MLLPSPAAFRLPVQVTDVVGQECLQLMERFRGGLLGVGHSWVSAPPAATPAAPAAALAPPAVPQQLPDVAPALIQTSIAVAPSAAELEARILELAAACIPDVDPRRPLAEQGLDSLAALELRQKIQEATGLELMTLIEDPQGATVAAIAQEAVAAAAASAPAAVPEQQRPATAQQEVALVQRQRAAVAGPLWVSPAPVAIKMRIFCLPYAGGVSENVFARWAQLLPASVQVCPVEIPGRGRREGEPAINDVKELARLLARSLPLSDKPYAIFGTCLGVIVGYELVREVERTGCAPLPVCFMPSAVSPPHLYAVAVMKLYLQRKLGECRTSAGLVQQLLGVAAAAHVSPALTAMAPTLAHRPWRGATCGGGDEHPAWLEGPAQAHPAQGL